jgi:pseudouridylate synthase
MNPYLEVRPEVAAALERGTAVVALESTVIAHGLPRPQNLEAAGLMEAVVRQHGAVPATIGLTGGKLVVGLDAGEIEMLANSDQVHKVSRRDIASVVSSRQLGATTVAATMWIAAQAGVHVLATGGIGGVHRGAEETFDISADLSELARTPVAVICAGAKIILDLPRTLEVLETLGVPVVGYGTSEFPAFYVRESGLVLDARVDSAQEAAHLMRVQWTSGLSSAVVFANPPSAAQALGRKKVEELIAEARRAAATARIEGKAVTPYLLDYLGKASGGATRETNIALLVDNARVAAGIAVAYARYPQTPVKGEQVL